MLSFDTKFISKIEVPKTGERFLILGQKYKSTKAEAKFLDKRQDKIAKFLLQLHDLLSFEKFSLVFTVLFEVRT